MANTFLISSKDRTSGESNDLVYKLQESALGSYSLNHFQITNNIYNVLPENSSVYIEHSTDGAVTVVLDPGYYTIEDLRATLQTDLSSALASTAITVTLDSVTNKLTFDSSVGNIKFNFATNTANSARYLLGFDQEDTVFAASVESSNACDLKLHDLIVVAILQDNNQNITLPGGAEATFIIPIESVDLGDRINFTRGRNFTQYCKFITGIVTLNIKLFSIDGDLLDVSKAEWTMSLEKLSSI